MELGEGSLQAAKRELSEETGISGAKVANAQPSQAPLPWTNVVRGVSLIREVAGISLGYEYPSPRAWSPCLKSLSCPESDFASTTAGCLFWGTFHG